MLLGSLFDRRGASGRSRGSPSSAWFRREDLEAAMTSRRLRSSDETSDRLKSHQKRQLRPFDLRFSSHLCDRNRFHCRKEPFCDFPSRFVPSNRCSIPCENLKFREMWDSAHTSDDCVPSTVVFVSFLEIVVFLIPSGYGMICFTRGSRLADPMLAGNCYAFVRLQLMTSVPMRNLRMPLGVATACETRFHADPERTTIPRSESRRSRLDPDSTPTRPPPMDPFRAILSFSGDRSTARSTRPAWSIASTRRFRSRLARESFRPGRDGLPGFGGRPSLPHPRRRE